MQRSSSGTVGRHRQELLHRHRAPGFPALFADRSRSVLSATALAATLATGIGIAGVAGATPAIPGASGDEQSAGYTQPATAPTRPPAASAFGSAGQPLSPGTQPTAPVLTDPSTPLGTAAPHSPNPSGTAPTHPNPPATAASTYADPLTAPPASYPAAPKGYVRQARPGALATGGDAAAENPSSGPAAAPMQLKDRPVIAPQWVNPMPAGRLTSCFGQRWGRLHAGVDLAAPHGTPVVAAGAGVVVSAGPAAGYGNAVLIDHGNGYLTHYGHLSTIAVRLGQDVAAGQQIGGEGSTGHSTGPHLHFEVHRDFYKNPVEPTAWMRAHGIDLGCA